MKKIEINGKEYFQEKIDRITFKKVYKFLEKILEKIDDFFGDYLVEVFAGIVIVFLHIILPISVMVLGILVLLKILIM